MFKNVMVQAPGTLRDQLGDALLVALLPLVGYGCAWCFAVGHAIALRIPVSFIRLGGENIAAATITLVLVFGGAFGLERLGDALGRANHPILRHVAVWVSGLSLAWMLLWIEERKWAVIAAGVVIPILSYLGKALSQRRVALPDNEEVEFALKDLPTPEQRVAFLEELLRKSRAKLVKIQWRLAFAVLSLLLVLSINLGRVEALRKSTWQVLMVNGTEHVLLAVYGDLVVSAPYSGTTIQPAIFTQQLGSTGMSFQSRQLGRLTVAAIK